MFFFFITGLYYKPNEYLDGMCIIVLPLRNRSSAFQGAVPLSLLTISNDSMHARFMMISTDRDLMNECMVDSAKNSAKRMLRNMEVAVLVLLNDVNRYREKGAKKECNECYMIVKSAKLLLEG